jgi:hypothetical protein
MERNDQLSLIRQKCIEALCAHGTRSEQSLYTRGFDRPIRLADVLLAITKASPNNHNRVWLKSDGRFVLNENGNSLHNPADWNLRKDDLTEQSEECINFIYELLHE